MNGPDPVHRYRIMRAVLLVAALLCGTAPACADAPETLSETVSLIAQHVAEAARQFGIPESWIWAVMRVESSGNSRAVSRAGATGLMQIMPGTWTKLRARYGLGANIYDPRDNIMAGAAYLREMHDRYGPMGMLAAYNAGPGRYEDYRDRGRPLPAETVSYVAKLAPRIGSAAAFQTPGLAAPIPVQWTRASLFIARSGGDYSTAEKTSPIPPSAIPERAFVASWPSSARQPDGLFVPLSGQSPR